MSTTTNQDKTFMIALLSIEYSQKKLCTTKIKKTMDNLFKNFYQFFKNYKYLQCAIIFLEKKKKKREKEEVKKVFF